MDGSYIKTGIGILLLFLISEVAFAQYTIQHQAPIAVERNEPNRLEFTLPGITQGDIQQARIFYRYDGDFGYQQQEVDFQNGAFRTNFEIDNRNASTLEYYFEVSLISGESVYFPGNLPSENPVTVEIVEELEEKKKQLQGVDYTILSPEPGSGVVENDIVIAIALFYDMAALDPGEFKLYLDQEDVTGEADMSPYYISYNPKNLRGGTHRIAIEYATENEIFAVTEWDFVVINPEQRSYQGFGESHMPQVNVEMGARNQVIAGDINNAYTGRTRVSGKFGLLRYSLSGYLTSQESARLQPQNRYGIDLRLGKWWKFEAGHVYPSMTQFTISGRRVHGLNTSLHLLNEKLNVQFIYGELDRSITNLYDSLIVRDISNNAGSVVDQSYLLTYQNGGRGTFSKKITGGRIGIGNEEEFQIGVHALKIEDDTTSIFNIQDYLDISNANFALNNNLSQPQRDSLLANPDLLEIQGGNVTPKANLVAGSDLKMGFLNNRIRFETEVVVSALNENIYEGPLTSERADELGFELDKGTSDLLERLSWLIIINENMNTLPLQISENRNGDFEADPFFPSSILAGNSEFSYRNHVNNLRFQYRWIGPNFNSLANSTIRRDVAGFTISDRLNLLSNRVYLTLGYENLNDNVTGNRDATTRMITYRTNASWYPVDRKLPRISAGLRYRTRGNGVERQNHLLSNDLVNAAVQNIRQELRTINNEDTLITLVTPTPRMNKTMHTNASITQQFDLLNAINDASISFTNLTTTDEVFAFGDVSSTSLSFSLSSRFNDAPYETQLGFTHNNTESGSGQNQIKITGFYAGGNIRMLEGKLILNGRLAVTQNISSSRPLEINDNNNENTQDDYFVLQDDVNRNTFQTYVLQAGARYNIDDYHSLLLDTNLTNVSGSGRANDRIVQLRYIFRF